MSQSNTDVVDNIKLILFDWFGVVNGELTNLMMTRFGFNEDQQLRVAEINNQSNRGEIDVQDVYTEFAKLIEQSDGRTWCNYQVKTWFDNHSRTDADLLEIIDQFRSRGIKAVVASNAATDHRGNLVNMGMKNHFDEIYVSSLIGHDKPSPGFFYYILAEQNTLASDALFIDDSPVNVEGARAAGLHAEQYGEYGDLTTARSIFSKYHLI